MYYRIFYFLFERAKHRLRNILSKGTYPVILVFFQLSHSRHSRHIKKPDHPDKAKFVAGNFHIMLNAILHAMLLLSRITFDMSY